MSTITRIEAMEVIDSRGNPTIEVVVETKSGAIGCAIVPSGASTGKFEAHELRDENEKRFLGKGVLKAVKNVNETISKHLLGKDVTKQKEIDQALIDLDGSKNKVKLGANAILGVSLAVSKAAANYYFMPYHQYIGGINGYILPTPMMNIINGGMHAANSIDFQEFMIVPTGAKTFKEALRQSIEVFHHLKAILKAKNHITSTGDEGGFAPNLSSNKEAIELIVEAIKAANYVPGKDFYIALDVASSEFYEDGTYHLTGEHRTLSSIELIDYYKELIKAYPIISIEDGLDQEDEAGWKELTKQLGDKVQLVGDDLFVTNQERLQNGINQQIANSILIKPNQIGTLSETIETIMLAKKNGYTTIMSHRSGESEDTTIASLAVGLNTMQIKTGSLSRSERIAKYNELLRIEHYLGDRAVYLGIEAYHIKSNK